MTNKLKIFSMFDGVGGFIVGLDNANKEIGTDTFETIVSNQFEPSRKSQDAYEVGLYQYPDMEHIPDSVEDIPNEKFESMKKDGVNMIVAGFPCQDYSVARSKKGELGIEGKKGVLFWEIIRAVNHIEPDYLILENVDRLLKAPSSQRGRDFAVMLGAFNQLGYSVEWRVINAAEYGRAQRRRRVFFFIYKNTVPFAQKLDKKYGTEEFLAGSTKYDEYIFSDGLFARQFPVKDYANKDRRYTQLLSTLTSDSLEYIPDISDNFVGTIWNTGVMRHGRYYTVDTISNSNEEPITLGEIVEKAKEHYPVSEKYYITDEKRLERFHYLRGPKRIERTSANGHTYTFSEGGMSPFDSYDLPARTMLTSEGSLNRSTHFLKDEKGYRILTPVEAELLQDFPVDWTKYKKTENGIEEVSDRMRYFFMGNALVTGIVKRIGIELANLL